MSYQIFYVSRVLQQQTEKSLIDYQNRLSQAENDLAQTACEQGTMDAKFIFTNKTIANLKDEATKLKDIIDVLEKDRSEMHVRIGSLFVIETSVSKYFYSPESVRCQNRTTHSYGYGNK